MKARNLLKILFTMTAVFAFTATFAQNPPYAEMTATQGDGPDMVTVSDDVTKYVPYFVEPDATINSFSGDYDQTDDDLEGQGIKTTFSWSYTGDGDLQYQPDNNNDEAPYVEISFTNTGDFELSVEETSPGGCTGDAVTLDITVVDEPEFDVTGGSDNDTIEICDQPGEPITVSSISDNGVSGGDLKFHVDSIVENLDANGDPIDAGGGNPIADETVYPTISETEMGDSDVEVFTHDLITRNGEITRYSFTFYGMSDHVSRKTDFLNNQAANDEDFEYYTPSTSGNTLVYVVYPTPETGDIRYVPDDFDL